MRLQAIGINKSYGATHALRDVQLAVAAGEIHALLGENGAGKSTLVKILSGAERPDRGLMLLDSQPYAPEGPIQAREEGVAIVCQETTLAGDLSVEENLLLGSEPARRGWIDRQQRRELARAALAELASEDLPLGARVGSLPYADQQRVEIARALASRPSFMLLDEPLAGIDPIAVDEVRGLVKHLKDRGIGVLITDHNVRETLDIIDRAYIMHDGSVLMEGSPSEIVSNADVRRVYLGEKFSL